MIITRTSLNGKKYPPLSPVGAMKIARQPGILASTPMNGTHQSPAPSLRELARPTGVTEGVSSDGCSMPMVYKPAHIGSEIFERLRSSKYTPSVSLRSTAPSEREPGMGAYHSTSRSETVGVRAIFIAPTKLRGGEIPPFIVPPGNRGVAGDFHRPYGKGGGVMQDGLGIKTKNRGRKRPRNGRKTN